MDLKNIRTVNITMDTPDEVLEIAKRIQEEYFEKGLRVTDISFGFQNTPGYGSELKFSNAVTSIRAIGIFQQDPQGGNG